MMDLLRCPFCNGPAADPRGNDVHCQDRECAGFFMRHCPPEIWNRRGPKPPNRNLTREEQKAQGSRCPCGGADDLCVCQNVPDRTTLAKWADPAAQVGEVR